MDCFRSARRGSGAESRGTAKSPLPAKARKGDVPSDLLRPWTMFRVSP